MKVSTRPTCRRCKRRLTAVYTTRDVRIEQETLEKLDDPSAGPDVITRTVQDKLLGYGYGAQSTFCTLTCGFWWATEQIKKGEAS